MKVSVIMPVYRHWGEAAGALRALQAQSFPADQFEILLVNNDPNVPPPADLVLPDNARVIDEAKPGSYAARNAGLREARGEILCFTDADCTPVPGWIEAAVNGLQAQEGLARVGGPIELIFSGPKLTLCETHEKHQSFNQDRYINQFNWSATANMATYAAAFDKVGPFDDSRMSGGDKNWGMRAHDAGIPIKLLPDMVVGHPARATWGALIAKQRRLAGGKLIDRVAKRGKGRARLSYLISLPFRLVPITSAIRRIFFFKEPELVERVKLYLVYYVLRLARTYEQGRLLFFGGDALRR